MRLQNYNIFINYNMPAKMSMVIVSNRNYIPSLQLQVKPLSVSALPTVSSSLNAPIISRIHTTRPGCGSCGGRK